MAVDLHLHARTDHITEAVWEKFHSMHTAGDPDWNRAYDLIAATPSVFVACGPADPDVVPEGPQCMPEILALFPDRGFIRLTPDLAEQILASFRNDPLHTAGKREKDSVYVLAPSIERIERFLSLYEGSEIFPVLW